MSRKKGEEDGASTNRETQSYESEEGKTNRVIFAVIWNETCALLI